jgi:hypothetical protein
MHPSPVFVGIDVAKATLDVALRPGDQTWQMDHDETTIAQRVEQLQALSPTRIVGHRKNKSAFHLATPSGPPAVGGCGPLAAPAAPRAHCRCLPQQGVARQGATWTCHSG